MTKAQEASLLKSLDPGIRYAVKVLREGGIETFESCDGGKGHSFPEPTIRFHGQYGEGFRAFAIAHTFALPVYQLRRVYDHEDHELVGPCWELVFVAPSKAQGAHLPSESRRLQ